ncbi:hypothetical protein [Nannocystis radixulma]|uniref:Lipoprotein n=1 Tax=Nannocystis radixulma TaxID=2995305 RepID=A0ABT5BCX0_9BACT|nr:hypothetical protein [Nannocystis radixulma]MDC0670851.1 hypothetical protein [Nannocystis radixulma]
MVRVLLLSSSLALVSACGPEFEPRDGHWAFAEGKRLEDSCGLITGMLASDFSLVANGDGTITLDADNTNGSFECDLSGREFECPEHQVRAMSGQAKLDIWLRFSGTFSSETEASGRRDAEVTCDGAGCDGLAALARVKFPCAVAMEFTASRVQ